MSRKVLVGLVSFAVLAMLVVGLWFVTAPRHRINPDGFARIQVEMTLDEVESILRIPPGDYTSGPTVVMKEDILSMKPIRPTAMEWRSDDGRILVYFHGGKVSRKEYDRVRHLEKSFLREIRRWLGL